MTEVQLVQNMIEGVKNRIALEEELAGAGATAEAHETRAPDARMGARKSKLGASTAPLAGSGSFQSIRATCGATCAQLDENRITKPLCLLNQQLTSGSEIDGRHMQ